MFTLKQILCILGLFLLNSLPLQASDDNWAPIAEKIIQHIEAAEGSYQANDLKVAKQFIIKAYFGVFEDKKMEAAMRQELGSKYTYQVEKLFGNLRKAMTKGASNDEVAKIVASIREAMRKDAKKLDQAGIPLEVFRVNQ
jgi:flagellin-specific chaperone FliS